MFERRRGSYTADVATDGFIKCPSATECGQLSVFQLWEARPPHQELQDFTSGML